MKQHQLNVLALGAIGSAARGYRVQPAPFHGHGPGGLTIAPPLRDSGYELLTRPGHPADSLLTSAAVSAALAHGAASPLVVGTTRFRAPFPPFLRYALLARFTRRKSTVLFNGEKIRLRSDPYVIPNFGDPVESSLDIGLIADENSVADLECFQEHFVARLGIQLRLRDVLGERAVDESDIRHVGDNRPRHRRGKHHHGAAHEHDRTSDSCMSSLFDRQRVSHHISSSANGF